MRPDPRPTAATVGPPTAADPVELRLARAAFLLVVALAVPAVAVAGLLVGGAGAIGAAIGAAVVAGSFLLSGAMMSWAARFGPTALMGAALGGYLLKLMIYAVLIILLRPLEAIHGPSLAITAALLLVAALVFQARRVSRTAGLFWVDADAGRPAVGAVPSERTPA